jgi:hypothetical protein
MARKRVALIIPLNDRNTGAYQRNLALARQWRSVLLLSGRRRLDYRRGRCD